MLPPGSTPGSSATPSASTHSELDGQAMASLGLSGPLHSVHVAGALALTSVEYRAFPLLSETTHSFVPGTHDTAFSALPGSIACSCDSDAWARAGPQEADAPSASATSTLSLPALQVLRIGSAGFALLCPSTVTIDHAHRDKQLEQSSRRRFYEVTAKREPARERDIQGVTSVGSVFPRLRKARLMKVSNVNCTVLTGRLLEDAVLETLPSGFPMCNFELEVRRRQDWEAAPGCSTPPALTSSSPATSPTASRGFRGAGARSPSRGGSTHGRSTAVQRACELSPIP